MRLLTKITNFFDVFFLASQCSNLVMSGKVNEAKALMLGK